MVYRHLLDLFQCQASTIPGRPGSEVRGGEERLVTALQGSEVGDVLRRAATGQEDVKFLRHDEGDEAFPVFLVDGYEVVFFFIDGFRSNLIDIWEATAPDGREGDMSEWD